MIRERNLLENNVMIIELEMNIEKIHSKHSCRIIFATKRSRKYYSEILWNCKWTSHPTETQT